ncbi:hypothetical protein TCAL_08045 [Tigriopus californicus]|uniref:Uncharacterized protein n=1 Tax=Tigriopus californicus TaxID=6832 RepID=A0A553NQ76_TIGCA|nr:G2/mitotic-specific cyclin-B3-like [Tigriopus californicus]TRY67585.1 hypothetical protein TCAL_08045 [Tigriopus californicus]|eukprot:TCALIF_08045-PA protein Name:"Similar to CycB3 G2/mitotic-specific cyclin-B3 (Drosophila melanogaster)" AED:0.04 eAED:0.04 QI:215/1/1/1/0.83/0.71/7/402/512
MPRVTRSRSSVSSSLGAGNAALGVPGVQSRGLKKGGPPTAAVGLALRAQVGPPARNGQLNPKKFTLDSNKRRKPEWTFLNEPQAQWGMSKDENGSHAPTGKEGGAMTKAHQKRRAALGEITNAFSETTAQAKKGLSKMLNRSKTKLTGTTQSQIQPPVLARKSQSVPEPTDECMPLETSFDAGGSRLPASQPEEFKSAHFVPSPSHWSDSDQEDDDDDVYESANEGDDQNDKSSSDERVLPPGVVDFDAQNMDDPSQASEYAMETFQYYRNREEQFQVEDYLTIFQYDINSTMRAILVDWLVEVQESFELNHETLYTAVKLMDIYLSKTLVLKEHLQLIGAVACLIACKIDERIPPLLDDFVYVCDDAYTKDMIKAKEIEMFADIGFDLGFPLSYRFLRRYARVCGVTMPVLTFARYILELSLMEYHLNVQTSESKLGMAALVLALRIKGVEDWQATLEYYSGYKVEECQTLVEKLHLMLLKPGHDNRKTIRTKYSHKVFHEVALIQIPRSF